MFNETLTPHSLEQLKNVIFRDLTTLDLALIYLLTYVVYKALGRYVYFKPQEHASKINRTFLVLSLLVVFINILRMGMNNLPILDEYRWLFLVCSIVILIAPLSIIMNRILWQYDQWGHATRRNWAHYFLPIPRDYYKTNVGKSETRSTSSQATTLIQEWEEEGVESTSANLHSDALLNTLALIVFLSVSLRWTLESVNDYGRLALALFFCTALPVAAIFFDRSIFSWIDYLQRRKN